MRIKKYKRPWSMHRVQDKILLYYEQVEDENLYYGPKR